MIPLSFVKIALGCTPLWVFLDLRVRILGTRQAFDVFDDMYILR